MRGPWRISVCVVVGSLATLLSADDPARDVTAQVRLLTSEVARGRLELLRSAELAWFLNPPLIASPDDPGLLRPWTDDLRSAIGRTHAASRAEIASVLDALWQRSTREPHLAAHFVIAPQAIAVRRSLLNHMWDRGAFAEFLREERGVARDLNAAAADPRVALATVLQREKPALDLPNRLGEVLPPATTIDDLLDGWTWHDGWIMPDDQAWRTAVGTLASCVSGHDGILVARRTGDPVRWYSRLGELRTLPVMPASVKPLGVSDCAAFFGDGLRTWRVDVRGDVREIAMPEATIGRPIVRDDSSLWLGRHHVWLMHGTTLVGRWAHRADDPSSLAMLRGTAVLMTAQGARVLERVPNTNNAETLIAEHRGAEAVVHWPELTRAWLACPALARAQPQRALAATVGTVAETMALLRMLGRDHDAQWATLCREHPGTALPGGQLGDDAWAFPEQWPHTRSAGAWLLASSAISGATIDKSPLALSTAATHAAPVLPLRLSLERDDRWFSLSAAVAMNAADISAPNIALADGTRWLWTQRWRGSNEHDAPVRAVWLSQGVAWVAEGEQFVTIFDAHTGDHLGRWAMAPGDRSSEHAAWCASGVAVAGRDALGWRIRWPLSGELLRLDDEPLWLVPGGTGVLAATARGLWMVTPTAVRAVQAPAALLGGTRPAITPRGLERDGQWWAWLR